MAVTGSRGECHLSYVPRFTWCAQMSLQGKNASHWQWIWAEWIFLFFMSIICHVLLAMKIKYTFLLIVCPESFLSSGVICKLNSKRLQTCQLLRGTKYKILTSIMDIMMHHWWTWSPIHLGTHGWMSEIWPFTHIVTKVIKETCPSLWEPLIDNHIQFLWLKVIVSSALWGANKLRKSVGQNSSPLN